MQTVEGSVRSPRNRAARGLVVIAALAASAVGTVGCGASDDRNERVAARSAGIFGDNARTWPPGTTPQIPFSAVGLVTTTYRVCNPAPNGYAMHVIGMTENEVLAGEQRDQSEPMFFQTLYRYDATRLAEYAAVL